MHGLFVLPRDDDYVFLFALAGKACLVWFDSEPLECFGLFWNGS